MNCFWVCSFTCYSQNHNYHFNQDTVQWESLRSKMSSRDASASVIVVTKLLPIILPQSLLTFYALCWLQITRKSHQWLYRTHQGTAIAWIKIQTSEQGLNTQWWNGTCLSLHPLCLHLPVYKTPEITFFLFPFPSPCHIFLFRNILEQSVNSPRAKLSGRKLHLTTP